MDIKEIKARIESHEKQSKFFGVEISPERVAELKDMLEAREIVESIKAHNRNLWNVWKESGASAPRKKWTMNKIEKLYAEARAADDSILADGAYTNENGSTIQGKTHSNDLTLENVRCHLLREIKCELEAEDNEEEFDPYDLQKLTHQYLTLKAADLSYWKDVWYYCEAICCE